MFGWNFRDQKVLKCFAVSLIALRWVCKLFFTSRGKCLKKSLSCDALNRIVFIKRKLLPFLLWKLTPCQGDDVLRETKCWTFELGRRQRSICGRVAFLEDTGYEGMWKFEDGFYGVYWNEIVGYRMAFFQCPPKLILVSEHCGVVVKVKWFWELWTFFFLEHLHYQW